MRRRLIIVFLVPMTVILLALGGAYAWSVARSIQQEVANQQLGDLSYFLPGVRQALRAGNPGIVQSEMERYSELYDARVAVFDRSGALWASGGPEPESIDEDGSALVDLALSGRRSDPSRAVLPWSFGETMVVEPVFDDGNVIGAVVIEASAEGPRSEIFVHWALLVSVSALVLALLFLAVTRLANWVLQPMRRVDQAMVAIEHGEMDARISDDTGPPEMRLMIRMFNQMAEEIERVVSRQQEFAMNASHELRNPLGALLMRVEYLATGLDRSWDEEVEKAREEGRRMSRILDTLLGMARAGQKDSLFAPVDLVELVEGRVAAWEEVAHEKRVALAVSGETGIMSVTDRTAAESALDAVLDNALRFAPPDTSIDVSVDRDDEGCVIAVRDRGPGLDPDELERVTSRFWRSPRDRRVPGSGLGLAIATDLLDTLHGRVELSVPDGGGLRVALHLPAGEY